MQIALVTGIGLGVFIDWMVRYRPYWWSTSVTSFPDNRDSRIPFLLISIVSMGGIFYLLDTIDVSNIKFLRFGVLFVIISAAALFDLYYQLIPNRLIGVGILCWMGFLFSGNISVLHSLAAGIGMALLFGCIRGLGYLFYNKAGMGIGDIKLVLLIGLFIQWDVFWVSYLAVMMGGFWAIAGISLNMLNNGRKVPFAPFLWAGSVLSVFFIPFQSLMDLWR